MGSGSVAGTSFEANLDLLLFFLARRGEIVEDIQGLLSAQRKSPEFLRDAPALAHHFEDCFFAPGRLSADQVRLRGQLKAAHWAAGFRPSVMPGVHNDLVDPGEMMVRGFHLWGQTRWPGRNVRLRFAHTLFNLYALRWLALLSMRLWDEGTGDPGGRLARIQDALDQLWKGSPADQPVFVRDARWLFPLAQSPTTDELGPYFQVAECIARTLGEQDRLQIHKASVVMAGGHLRSQLRHYTLKQHVGLDENSLVLSSRNSNALDFSLLIQGLVPLLKAYAHARERGDAQSLELAEAICQGISADPELFVNRVDLLGAYSMIEYLFVQDRDGTAAYTPTGQRHVQLLAQYAALIGDLKQSLQEDCVHFRPEPGRYSPYGLIYGFSSNLTEHMALKTLAPGATTRFTLEDAFAQSQAGSDRLDWVNGWRKLPHINPQVQRQFDYPGQFAAEIFERIERALGARSGEGAGAVHSGCLFVADDHSTTAEMGRIPELAVQYLVSSDVKIVTAHKALACDEAKLLHDRQEGTFLVSYQTPGGWMAITKDLLTEVLGAGQDARISGLTPAAAGALRLMYPMLVRD